MMLELILLAEFIIPRGYTIPDYCVVDRDDQGIYRVMNPDACQDKKFVKYMNCWDSFGNPPEGKPKECK